MLKRWWTICLVQLLVHTGDPAYARVRYNESTDDSEGEKLLGVDWLEYCYALSDDDTSRDCTAK